MDAKLRILQQIFSLEHKYKTMLSLSGMDDAKSNISLSLIALVVDVTYFILESGFYSKEIIMRFIEEHRADKFLSQMIRKCHNFEDIYIDEIEKLCKLLRDFIHLDSLSEEGYYRVENKRRYSDFEEDGFEENSPRAKKFAD